LRKMKFGLITPARGRNELMWLIAFALTVLFLIPAPAAVYDSNGSVGDVQRQIRKCVNGDI
jgi:hypothetical protein